MVRTPSSGKRRLRRGLWSPEEDMKLVAYVTRYENRTWREISQFAGLERSGECCRLRWINYLRPKRGNFSPQEEDLIIALHKLLGDRWSAIAARVPGRTDNQIKNHWHTTLKKRSQQNTLTNEEARASKSKNKESMDSVPDNGVTVPFPATSQISNDSSSLFSFSSLSSSSKEFSSGPCFP